MSWFSFSALEEQAKKTFEKAVQQVDRVLDIHEDTSSGSSQSVATPGNSTPLLPSSSQLDGSPNLSGPPIVIQGTPQRGKVVAKVFFVDNGF